MKILLFGGTAEGHKLSRLLAEKGIEVVLCVATDYGKTMVKAEKNITVRSGRMNEDEMTVYMKEDAFDCVVDTTHPYANIVTQNIKSACEKAGVNYLRLLREKDEKNGAVVYVPTAEAAVEILNSTTGNIFLTIGSKELGTFTRVENYTKRIYVRIIPMTESLQKAQELGFQNKNIICMQGPFDFEINKAMLASTGAMCMVTKDSGDAGGFSDKVSAALAVGCKVIVIARPTQETGMSFNEILNFFQINTSQVEEENQSVFFPLFFDLTNKQIVVVGGGKIAERRIAALVKFGANIILISPTLTENLEKLSREQRIMHVCSEYKQSELERWKPFLVISATDNHIVNQTVMYEAKKLGIPRIISDCKEQCDVYFPALAENDSFIAGIISKNGNHKAVKDMAQNIRRMFNGS